MTRIARVMIMLALAQFTTVGVGGAASAADSTPPTGARATHARPASHARHGKKLVPASKHSRASHRATHRHAKANTPTATNR